jgi:hypothetical protein
MTRTNTPLQALTLLNDQTFMEASQALAKRMLATTPEKRLPMLYQAVLNREPTAKELSVLLRELHRASNITASIPKTPVNSKQHLNWPRMRSWPLWCSIWMKRSPMNSW